MLTLLRKIIPSGVLRAQFLKVVRWLATITSTALGTWIISVLSKHGYDTTGALGDEVANLTATISAIIMAVGALGFSLWDAKKVDAQIKTAAATGAVLPAGDAAQLRADAAKAAQTSAAVADALQKAPTTDAAVDQRLKDHSV